MKKLFYLPVLLCLFAHILEGQNNAPLSERAPTDKPVKFSGDEKLKEFEKKIEPYVKKARKTLPQAKKRFLAGLPQGEAFFLTVRIFDTDGRTEQVFIRVKEWSGDKVSGYIANDLNVVREFKPGQLIAFTEKSILDWLITKPDGSEEGNYVGKYLDTQQ